MACRYGWAEVCFWQVAQNCGSAGSWKSLWHMSWVTQCWKGYILEWSRDLACPILQSSLSQVTGAAEGWPLAPLFWLTPVNMTLAERCQWHQVIKCSEVNKPTGGKESLQCFPIRRRYICLRPRFLFNQCQRHFYESKGNSLSFLNTSL